jgi:hypothetical protein
VSDFVALTRPRAIMLAVFTALVGFEMGLERVSSSYFVGEHDRLVLLASHYSVSTVYQW